jgi:phage gpG-like protein
MATRRAKDTPQVTGAAKLAQRIATITERLDLPDLTEEIGRLLLRRTLQRFDREVSPNNVPWVPLADATLARKKRGGYGDRNKLVRTEKMRNAIKIIRGRNQGTTYGMTNVGIRIGIQDPEIAEYARLQNSGDPGRIPARRFLGVGRLDIKAVDSLLRRKADQMMGV